jgi:YHS domain-containing protein
VPIFRAHAHALALALALARSRAGRAPTRAARRSRIVHTSLMQWTQALGLATSLTALACAAPATPNDPAERHEEHAHAGHEQAAAPQPSAATSTPAAPAALTRIGDTGGVCMLSNRFLGEHADVPIQVEGKTYRGCCASCAARLGSQAEARTANDPVTGKPVDKATAVLARDATNRVYYFESEATFTSFAAR